MKGVVLNLSRISSLVLKTILLSRSQVRSSPNYYFHQVVFHRTQQRGVRKQSPVIMSVKRTILHRHPIPELPGYESRMVRLEYGPGAVAAPHTHPVDGVNLILEGEVLSQWEGSDEVEHYKTGEIFIDYANKVHTKVENPSKTDRFVVVVTYVIKVDEPNVKMLE